MLSRGNTNGPAYGAAAGQLLEFDPDGNFVREIGHNLYAWSFAHQVRVDRHDDIWIADKGSDVVVRSGKVLKKFGWVHSLACPSENEIYVCGLLNWRAQTLLLHPGRHK